MMEGTGTPGMMEETPGMMTTPGMMESTGTPGMMMTPSAGGMNSGSAIDLITASGEAMKGLQSFHMSVQTEAAGANVVLEADVQVPDKVRMDMDMGEAGKVEVITIGGETFTKLAGTDSYMMSPGGTQTNSVTDATSFAQYAENAEVIGDETVDGVNTTHVKFVYDQDKAMSAMATPVAGAALMGKATAEMWIAKDTSYIKKFTYVSNAAGAASTSTITYSKYNEPISPAIEKPSNVTTMPNMETVLTPVP